MAKKSCFRKKKPLVAYRGVHFDLKGLPPTPERLISLLHVLKAARYNAVLVEWEDTFPWTVDPRFRCETYYRPDTIARFRDTAAELGIEVIPLVQCLGHMETPLRLPEYAHLRQVPDSNEVLNPLAPGATALVQKMVDDVLALFPKLKFFHLGGDEAWTLGQHPDCKAYIEAHGKGKLYLQHVGPILDSLVARKVRGILWHDMMREWPDEDLVALGRKADLMTWGYGGDPKTMGHHLNDEIFARFQHNGVPMWGAGAYKGADGELATVPNFGVRQENALAWARAAGQYKLRGLVATAWSRYSTCRLQVEPIDAALDALVNLGVIFHDGEAPVGGVEDCKALLTAIGEGERFAACHDLMVEFRRLVDSGWYQVRSMRSQLATSIMDPRRRGSLGESHSVDSLTNTVTKLDELAGKVATVFAGLIDQRWLDEYLGSHIEPLRAELGELGCALRLVHVHTSRF